MRLVAVDPIISVVMEDTTTASEFSLDFFTTSRFWLLFLEYFCGDLLPPREVFPELALPLDVLPLW